MIVITVLSLFIICSPDSSAVTHTVDSSGSGDFETIQEAIDNAVAGDEILVEKGVYSENVVVDKSLTIRASGDISFQIRIMI